MVVIGALLIWTIKYLVRPMYAFDDDLKFFLNIAPNLLGSFLIPFGAAWIFGGKNFLLARIFRVESMYDLRLVCIIGFGMLIVNEYLQRIPLFGRTFDYNDIIFSAAGLITAYFVFGRMLTKSAGHFIAQAG